MLRYFLLLCNKMISDTYTQSMRNAIYAAIDIAEHRRAWAEWTRNPLQRAERDRGGRDVSVKDLPQTEKED